MSTNTDDPVSGVTVFWCMAGLAMSCMGQSSFSGCMTSGDIFANSLYPHRSSPFVCLSDTIIDCIGPIRLFYRPDDPRDNHGDDDQASPVSAGALVITMRLVTAIFTILPLALQLFSMRGIPITQALGAIFFISAVLNIACNLRRVSPAASDLRAAEELQKLPERDDAIAPSKSADLYLSIAVAAQLLVLLYFCIIMTGRGHMQVPNTIAYIWQSITHFAVWSTLVLCIVQTRYNIVASKASPLCLSFLANYLAMLPIYSEGVHMRGRFRPRLVVALTVLLFLYFSCFGVAWLLTIGVQSLLKWRQRASTRNDEPTGVQEVGSAPTESRQSMDITDVRETPLDVTATTWPNPTQTSPCALDDSTRIGTDDAAAPERKLSPFEMVDEPSAILDMTAPNADKSFHAHRWSHWWVWPLALAFLLWMIPKQLRTFLAPSHRRKPTWRVAAAYFVYCIVRVVQAFFEVFHHGHAMLGAVVQSHSQDVSWIAFALLNFVVAGIYYLIMFDSTGTSMPAWSNLVN